MSLAYWWGGGGGTHIQTWIISNSIPVIYKCCQNGMIFTWASGGSALWTPPMAIRRAPGCSSDRYLMPKTPDLHGGSAFWPPSWSPSWPQPGLCPLDPTRIYASLASFASLALLYLIVNTVQNGDIQYFLFFYFGPCLMKLRFRYHLFIWAAFLGNSSVPTL